VTTAVGDSIRSKIGKPKEKTDQEIREETYRAADHGSADEPCVRVSRPPTEIMEIDLPGGGVGGSVGGGGQRAAAARVGSV
jgi:hypothetical protein